MTRVPVAKVKRLALWDEVKALKEKLAIYHIYPSFLLGFYASFVLTPKKTGD
jgi:hypothetical protein